MAQLLRLNISRYIDIIKTINYIKDDCAILVLNKDDTTNMLSAVKTVRELSNVINLQAISSKFSQLSNLTIPSVNINQSQESQPIE